MKIMKARQNSLDKFHQIKQLGLKFILHLRWLITKIMAYIHLYQIKDSILDNHLLECKTNMEELW